MKQILLAEGIEEIKCFENGLDCFREFHLNPEVVFLDHQTELLSDFETLRNIKKLKPNIFIIIVSALEDIEITEAVFKYGAFDCIRKNNKLLENLKFSLALIDKVINFGR